jgi:Spy/CpxP family protein refolding chaperone
MNLWKPTALVLASALAMMVSYNVASASSNGPKPVSVTGDYHHIRTALEYFRAGRNELMMAEHNRGGWRERAVEGADRTIFETKQALDW